MRDKLLGIMDLESEFSALLELSGSGDEKKALCPFHDDNTPSLSVNVNKGKFHCFGCKASGDFFTLFSKLRGVPANEVVQDFAEKYGLLDPVPVKVVDKMHSQLISNPRALKVLLDKKGLNKHTVDKYRLGYDGERYWIPIANSKGEWANVIRYLITTRRVKDKTLPYSKGRGRSLFPVASLSKKEIFIFEGMSDTLMALQCGFNAITGTGGAEGWSSTWNGLFTGKDVHICYDADLAGKRGAIRVARELYGVAASVHIRDLEKSGQAVKDFNDYITKLGHTADDFRALAEVEYKGEALDADAPEDKDLSIYDKDQTGKPMTLAGASNAHYYGKRVRFKAVVAGKMLAPYIVPLEGQVKCRHNFSPEVCPGCPCSKKDFKGFILTYEDHELLSMINVASQVQKAVIKRKIGIHRECNKQKITRTKNINLEEITLVPEINNDQQESKHVTRVAYVVGQGIETNKTYEFTAITLPDPTTQLATHLIYEAKASESNIDHFKIDKNMVKRLSIFRPTSWTDDAMDKKLEEIHRDYEAVHKMRMRGVLNTTVDLIYHSIRRFKFQGSEISRGYLDAMIIGETRTGKSEIAKNLIPHFKAGAKTTGEGMSFPGLIGGLHQLHNGRWEVSWGAVVLNDLREYTVDEAHSLPHDFWSKLSDYRSSGIITLTKIRTEKAFARTRLLWISNPPNNETHLSSYNNAVEAIPHIVGRPEDVARFDFAVCALEEEVPSEVTNAKADPMEQVKKYTSELCHDRIMFAWSRDVNDVVYTDKAQDLTRQLAMEEGKKYHSSIPLVQPQEQRIKLARISVAFASMFYSTDKTGSKVVVLPAHVRYAHRFLERIYSYPLNYARYSSKRHEAEHIKDEPWLTSILDEAKKEKFLDWDKLSQGDLYDIFNDIRDREKVREIIGGLLNVKAIKRIDSGSSRYYVKTKAFVIFLNKNQLRTGTLGSKKRPGF